MPVARTYALIIRASAHGSAGWALLDGHCVLLVLTFPSCSRARLASGATERSSPPSA